MSDLELPAAAQHDIGSVDVLPAEHVGDELEGELRRARHLQALAAETARLGTWTYDPLEGALIVDEQWRALHGLSDVPDRIDELFGDVLELHVPTISARLDAVFEGKQVDCELEYETRQGRWVLARIRRMSGRDEGVMTGTAIDISAQKRSEREAKERAKLQQLLLGVVSHDLKSPLQTILTALELLPSLGDLQAPQRRAIRRAEGAAGRAQRLVWDLLDLARHRLDGSVPIRPRDVEVSLVVEEVVGAARLRADDGVEFDVQVDAGARATLDPDRFAQVLVNLLDNAMEHGEGAKVRVEVELTEDFLFLSVHNPDSVIAASLLPQVFEPFEQGDEGSVRGMGLGLHIVQLLTLAHGGRATVTSTAEHGTTFTTSWPRFGPSGTSTAA